MKMKQFFSYTIISCLLPLVLSIPLFELMPWAARKNTYLDDFEIPSNFLEEAPIPNNHKTIGESENGTTIYKDNNQVKVKIAGLDKSDDSKQIEVITTESSASEDNANQIQRQVRNNLWYNTYDSQPISGLEHAFLNRMTWLKNVGIAKRKVKNCSLEACFKNTNDGKRAVAWFYRLLNQSRVPASYLRKFVHPFYRKRRDGGSPDEADVSPTPFDETSNPWWNAALKELGMKYKIGDPNHDLLMKYNLLMNYIFKLHM